MKTKMLVILLFSIFIISIAAANKAEAACWVCSKVGATCYSSCDFSKCSFQQCMAEPFCLCTGDTPQNSTLAGTNVTYRLESLESWRTSVETRLTSMGSRITLLEQWRDSINSTIAAIRLWLGFDSNPGICSAVSSCGSIPVSSACSKNSDCGVSGNEGAAYCASGDAYVNYRQYTCSNPGAQSAYCSSQLVQTLKTDCTTSQTCLSGSCVTNGGCSMDSNCGQTTLDGAPYCQNNGIYQNEKHFRCNNPNTANSYCDSYIVNKLSQDCGSQTCNNGACQSSGGGSRTYYNYMDCMSYCHMGASSCSC